ncbi:MAG: FAD-dependent oxidoreductase [Puniceicoccaceae bacterium]
MLPLRGIRCNEAHTSDILTEQYIRTNSGMAFTIENSGEHILETANTLPIAATYDVLVCGGGTAGIPAAIAAAREGAKVGLVERYGFVGGVAAFSIMPCWHCLNDHHSGILTEFAQRVGDFQQGPNPFSDNNHMEPETVKIVALTMLQEAGVDLRFHNWIADVITEDSSVRGVVTETKSGRRALLAKTVIDATGDGDVCTRAGAQFSKGDNGKVQGMSLRFRIGHINFPRYFDWVWEHRSMYKNISREDWESLREKAINGKAFFMLGDLSEFFKSHGGDAAHLPEKSYFNCSSIRPNELSLNATRVYHLDGTIEEDLSQGEVITRQQSYAIWRVLRSYVPGFEQSMIVETPAQVGVRETREIVGDYTLTEEDCRRNATFEDAVLTSKISFDVHDVSGYILENVKGVVDIPYRCLLPKGLENIIVVGRCMSCDHIANSTTRLQEVSHRTGQAGGTAAAMAAMQGITPRSLPVAQLQAKLQANGFETSQRQRYLKSDMIAGLASPGKV